MIGFKTSFGATSNLLIPLDRDGSQPLHHQLEAALRDAIRAGRLPRSSPLPSSRSLATDLGLSRGVVVEAYQQLTAEGYLVSRPGGYTLVAATQAPSGPARATETERPRFDLFYGRPDVSQFPRAAWLRSVRRVLTEAPHERLVYLDGRGAPELRDALADYLNRVRGTWAQPDNLVVCNGFAQGWALVTKALVSAGARTLAVEDPSFNDVRPVAAGAGLEVIGIPVSEQGLDVATLERSAADAVLVTPAHQLTGAVLSAQGRTALLEWAQRRRAIVVEDDYDAEYRYDQTPVGALQGLAPDHVIYAGSASKTLAPGLRLGWLIVPNRLVQGIAAAKVAADRGSPVLDQLAFADFLSRGEFDRHLRRMRPIYRSRRDALLRALAIGLPDVRPTGVSAGLHLIAWLPADLDETTVVNAAARLGVGINGLAPHRLASSDQGGLVFGYAKSTERDITAGIGLLAEAVHELRAGTAQPRPGLAPTRQA